jgi:type IV secretory pathway VirB10-like protein
MKKVFCILTIAFAVSAASCNNSGDKKDETKEVKITQPADKPAKVEIPLPPPPPPPPKVEIKLPPPPPPPPLPKIRKH